MKKKLLIITGIYKVHNFFSNSIFFRAKALITEKDTRDTEGQHQHSPKESRPTTPKKPPKPTLPNRPKNPTLSKEEAVEESEIDDTNRVSSSLLQKTEIPVDNKNKNQFVIKQAPKKPPPPKLQSPKSSVKKPSRPPIPRSPSLKSKDIPPASNTVAMESNSLPKVKPRPIPRPRTSVDRPVPSPRRPTSKNEFEDNQTPEFKPSEEQQSEVLSLSDQLLREVDRQAASTENPAIPVDILKGECNDDWEKENPEIESAVGNSVFVKESVEVSVSPPVNPETNHKVVVKQKSNSAAPYENLKVQSPTRKVITQNSPYENINLHKREDQISDGQSENIYSAPLCLDHKAENRHVEMDDESLYFAPSSKPIDIKGHKVNINDDVYDVPPSASAKGDKVNINDDVYDVPPSASVSVSPVKSNRSLIKAKSVSAEPQHLEENIYAAPISPHTIDSQHLQFDKDSVIDLQGTERQHASNPPSLSRTAQKPTRMNPRAPVIPYSMLRDSDQNQLDDSVMYSNIEEEVLYSAPLSTPIKLPDDGVENSRRNSQLSNTTTSPRDSMTSGSSRGSSIMENAVFMQEDTYNVPSSLIRGNTVTNGDDENEYSSIPTADVLTNNVLGSNRESRYVDMSGSPTLPPVKPPRPGSAKKRAGSEYESIALVPSSPKTKTTGNTYCCKYIFFEP